MSFLVGMLSGLDEARKAEYARQTAEQERNQQLEFNILSQLAQGPDDEIAAMAGAGLLEQLSGNNKIRRAKGLSGFFGNAQRSSFLPQIQAILSANKGGGMPAAPASPGGAALPGASPVEPKAQGGRASQPPMLEMPLVSRQGLGVAPVPEMPAVAQAGLGVAGQGMPALGGTGVPPPAPPETPQMRYRRLFPNAAEVAEQAEARKLMARFTTAIEAMRNAKTPEERYVVSGMAGAPIPQLRPTAVNVRYIDEMGVETDGVGVMGADGQIEVDGRPVRPVEPPTPITQRRRAPQSVDVVGPDGNLVRKYYDPDTMEEVNSVPRNLPPNLPPTYESGQVPMTGGGIGMIPRGAAPGTPPVRLLGAQQKPSASSTKVPDPKKSDRAREAAAFSKDVKARISEKAKAGKNIVTGALGLVSDADKDRITSEVTQGRFQSYTDLIRAEQGLDAGSAPPPVRTGGFGSPEGANAIADALKRRKQR